MYVSWATTACTHHRDELMIKAFSLTPVLLSFCFVCQWTRTEKQTACLPHAAINNQRPSFTGLRLLFFHFAWFVLHKLYHPKLSLLRLRCRFTEFQIHHSPPVITISNQRNKQSPHVLDSAEAFASRAELIIKSSRLKFISDTNRKRNVHKNLPPRCIKDLQPCFDALSSSDVADGTF